MNLVSIEGNIGSGKSTLLSQLKKHLSDNQAVVFIDEPVDVWTSVKDAAGLNIIEKYYADQNKYAFPFQMLAYISKLTFLMTAYKENPSAIFISERSLYTDRYVFAKMLHDMGKMEDICYTIYLKWFDFFIDQMNGKHRVIYVNTTVDTCMSRINARNRSGENNISSDYLRECDLYHIQMITHGQVSDRGEASTPTNDNSKPYFSDIHTIDGNIHRTDDKDWAIALVSVTDFIFSC